ncbi:hypothetical protein [Rhizobium halophilum]|uniref:hypothetical protein n=1 Tax=Rhizobium halophilum TaxID=2846852 RepID=UPI001EFDADF1|nr:hypothetical protein [Rhizobium halophilum]MCF6370853.1 hypothetical protein [Rhizobium halophilum]
MSEDEKVNRYFTLYELNDLAAVQHPAYLDLVRRPTPWSQKMRQHFSNVLRIPAETTAFGGRGMGAYVWVQALAVHRDHAAAASVKLGLVLHGLVRAGKVLAYRIGLAEPNQEYEVFAQVAQLDPDLLNVVVVIESSRRDALDQLQPTIQNAVRDTLQPQATLRRERLFKFLASFCEAEVPADRTQILAAEAMRSRFEEVC